MKKRKQHYVWRYYLKAWSSDEKIFCLRNGVIFRTNLMGVANKRDFYRLKELDEADVEFVKKLAIEQSTPFLEEVHLRTLEVFTSVFRVKTVLEKSGKNRPDYNQEIDELINNFEEELHGEVEKISISYINSILDKNIDFYKIKKDRMAFLIFLCFQYFRTNKTKSNMVSSVFSSRIPEELCNRFEKTYNIFSHIFAYNVAYSLAINSDFQILLVLNNSNIPFVTGDQPIINTFASSKSPKELVNELEFYYPISPHIAILITKENKYDNIDKLYLTESDIIHKYNSLIIMASYEQIYSDSKELLESYR